MLRGVTISGAHKFGPVSTTGSLDLQDPHGAATGKLLARRAKLLKLNADTRVAGWTLGAEWLASSKRYDNAANTNVLGGYGPGQPVRQHYRRARMAAAGARIDNLGDKAYQLARGAATPERSFYVGLRWSPK